MVCTLCINNLSSTEDCKFDLDKALLEIKNHYVYYKTALKEKENENKDLLYNNERLRKAVNKLNDQINSQSIQQSIEFNSSKRYRLDEKNCDEITVIDDEDSQCNSESVLDIALNGTALNETTSEIITETEMPSPQTNVIRRGIFDTKIKSSYTKNTLQHCKNDENRRPITIKKDLMITNHKTDCKANDWHGNKQTNSTIKVTQSKIIDANSQKLLKQSRLNFHMPETKQAYVLTSGLSKSTVRNQTENFDDEFDFDRTTTFCLNLSNAEKTGQSKEEIIFSPKNIEPSIIAITIPNPTVISVDESREEQESECSDDDFVVPNQASKRNLSKSTDNTKVKCMIKKPIDSKNVFDDNKPTCSYRYSDTTKLILKKEPITPPNLDAGKSDLTHAATSLSTRGNPIFMQTESSEELDEDFPRPINIKMEKKNRQIVCTNCNNHEQCVCEHFKNDDEFSGTPENFWNPHLDSFSEDDPRNEVLVDTRFVGIKRANIDAIKKF